MATMVVAVRLAAVFLPLTALPVQAAETSTAAPLRPDQAAFRELTYGLTGMFDDPDGDGAHGLNERIPVRSLYDGRNFLYACGGVRQVRAAAGG